MTWKHVYRIENIEFVNPGSLKYNGKLIFRIRSNRGFHLVLFEQNIWLIYSPPQLVLEIRQQDMSLINSLCTTYVNNRYNYHTHSNHT